MKIVELLDDEKLDSNSIVHNNELLSKFLEKNVLTARLTTNNQIMVNSSETIRFNAHSKSGSKLSFSDYGIKIGAGVSQILVSAVVSFPWDSPISTNGLISLNKNGSEFVRVNGSKPDENMSSSTTCPPFLLSVSEGDVITAYVFGTTDLVIQQGRTFMTVEVVN